MRRTSSSSRLPASCSPGYRPGSAACSRACRAQPVRSAEILRVLAQGNSSVALVASMHPAVLSLWLATDEVADPYQAKWAEQRQLLGDLAKTNWFGTITSEPGSGGDVSQSRAVARPGTDGGWLLSGQKHFGSGSGLASFMLTIARPAGEEGPDWFYADVRDTPWDGSRGMKLTAPWDGHGMTATQSHGFEFRDFPVARIAWPGNWRALADAAGPFIGTAVHRGDSRDRGGSHGDGPGSAGPAGQQHAPLRAGRMDQRRTGGLAAGCRPMKGCCARWRPARSRSGRFCSARRQRHGLRKIVCAA